MDRTNKAVPLGERAEFMAALCEYGAMQYANGATRKNRPNAASALGRVSYLFDKLLAERDELRARLWASATPTRPHDEKPLNQCDGCLRGSPAVNGRHVTPSGTVYMTCERELYEQQAPVRDAGPTPFAGRTTRREEA